MKKFAAIASALVMLGAASMCHVSLPVTSAASDAVSGKISEDLLYYIEDNPEEFYSVGIFLKAEDHSNEMDELVQKKLGFDDPIKHMEYLELSESEQLELMRTAKLDVIKDLFDAQRDDFCERVGIAREKVLFTSYYTTYFICELPSETIFLLAEDDEVNSISFPIEFDDLIENDPDPDQAMLNMLVSEDENFSDGGFIYRGGLKFDIRKNDDDKYTLIVYNIEHGNNDFIYGPPKDQVKLNTMSSKYVYSAYPEFHSGITATLTVKDENSTAAVDIIFYVNNEFPGFMNTSDIIDACRQEDLTKYIYPTITPGDIDNDGAINSSDASLILKAYAYSQTGRSAVLNKELFDCNGDGKIDSSDASMVLAYYSKSATSNDPIDWDNFKNNYVRRGSE